CSAIEDCSGSATASPDEARRRVRAWFRGKCAPRRLGLLGPGDCEDDLSRVVQGLDAQGNSVDEGLEPGLRWEHTPALPERRCIREEGGDVTVLADPEELEVEDGVRAPARSRPRPAPFPVRP